MSDFSFDDNDLVITQDEVNAYEKLVGENKKFKDSESLAKGKLESDNFINKLQSENDELRIELDKRLSVEEAVSKMAEQSAQSSQTPIENESGEQAPSQTEQVDINSLLDQKLAEREALAIQKSNFETSISKMKEAWGNDWQRELNTRSSQTGISIKELEGYAANNPTVFNSLVGLQATPSQTSQIQPSIDTSKMPENTGVVQNYKYFEKMRKENLSQYKTAAVQLQMYEKAKELGDSFYN